jgi:hypothetical protein
MGAEAPTTLFILLFVTVLTKPLLALVRCHFMTLALFSAWHSVPRGYVLKNFIRLFFFLRRCFQLSNRQCRPFSDH